MRHSLKTVAVFAIMAGAPSIAGEEQLAFDGMGSLMLEHEAEENRDEVILSGMPRYEQEAKCAEKEAELHARLEGLRLDLAAGVSFSASTLEEMSLTALDLTALELADVHVNEALVQVEGLRGEELEGLRDRLNRHRSEIESRRGALTAASDQALISSVQDALSKAQEALGSK